MRKVILFCTLLISTVVCVNAKNKVKHLDGIVPGPIIAGTQPTSPFIAAGTNVNASISNGAGILQLPSYTTAIIFGSKAAGLPGWAGDGATASFTTAQTKGEWVQFAISPLAGADLNITGFNITGATTSTTGTASASNFYAIAYATDTTSFGTATCTFLDSAGVAGNNPTLTSASLISSAFNAGQNIAVANGSTLYIRFYLWRKNASASSSQFSITNFSISGSSSNSSGGTPTTSVTNANICFGNAYLFNGNTYTTSGTYVVHLTNKAGADSAATLNLMVSAAPTTNNINLIGCNNVSYNNVTYTSSTIVYDTIRNSTALHCDSIYKVVNITISCLPVVNSFAPYIGKTDDTILIKGINFTNTTAVTFGDTAAKSFIILNDSTIKAIVGNGASGSVNVITSLGSFPLAGFTYKSANTTGFIVAGLQVATPFITAGNNVVTNISNGAGILQLPKDSATGIIFGSKAAGLPGWAGDGTTATYTTANAKGEWVQFTIAPAKGYDLHITGFNIAGFNTSASTSNTLVLAYSIGDTAAFTAATCTFLDSTGATGVNPATVATSLIGSSFNTGQSITVPNGTSLYVRVYMWRHNAASSSSQFAISDFSVTGTSSVTSGGTPTASTTNAIICNGNTYLFNGTSYSTSGTYITHLTNKAGADSAATLILTVSAAPVVNNMNLTGCNSVSYNNVTYTSSVIIIDTIRNSTALHCDSIYKVVNITISCVPVINSFAPFMGKTGDTILIKGVNFSAATAVTFGDTAAKSFMVINDSTIKAVVGNGASGNVTVINSYGNGLLAGFSYKSSNTAGLLVAGLQATTPFITPGNNVVASLTVGTGVLEAPKDTATGLLFGTKAVGLPGWAADGTTASFATANSKGEWVQFEVTPVKGFNAYVAGFKITGNNSSATTTNFYAIAYANGDTSMFGNGTCTFLNPAGITGNNLTTTSASLLNDSIALAQNITIANGTTLYVRVYMWRKNAASSSSQFSLTDFTVNGTTSSASGGIATSSVTNAAIGSGSYYFNGSTYSNAGTYTVHLTNAVGADSAAILHLIINPGLSNCMFVSYNNVSFYSGTVLRDTIKNSKGGDSIYNVAVITINPSVLGNIITAKLIPIPNAVVNLKGNDSMTIVANGNFSFNCLTAGNTDAIRLSKNNDITKANGVTTLDIALMQSHILGKTLLNSPYKLIAADINGDKKVTTLDIVYMKRLILAIDTTFNNTATGEKRLWTFVDSSFKFSDPTNPFPYKDSMGYSGLKATQNNQTFIGCKLGDVNWDWNPAVAKPDNNTINAVTLSYDAISNSLDNTIKIPIKVSNFKEMIGMQFTINFDADKLSWKGIANNMLNIDLGTTHSQEGKITFLWNDANNNVKTLADGTVIMELLFNRIGLSTTSPLSLDGSVTAIEAVDKDYLLHNVVMDAAKVNSASIGEQWVVSPNPASKGVIKVQLQSKENKSVVFRLTDNTGRIIVEQNKTCVIGSNSFELLPSKLLPAGVYYLHANGLEGNNVKSIIIQ